MDIGKRQDSPHQEQYTSVLKARARLKSCFNIVSRYTETITLSAQDYWTEYHGFYQYVLKRNPKKEQIRHLSMRGCRRVDIVALPWTA
jgi:hypothetical protein